MLDGGIGGPANTWRLVLLLTTAAEGSSTKSHRPVLRQLFLPTPSSIQPLGWPPKKAHWKLWHQSWRGCLQLLLLPFWHIPLFDVRNPLFDSAWQKYWDWVKSMKAIFRYFTLAIFSDIFTATVLLFSIVVIGVCPCDFSNMFYIQTDEDRAEIKSD